MMFPIKQRYKNLSKSQLENTQGFRGRDVSYKTKIQKFKQITTVSVDRSSFSCDVSYKTKIQKFKQITTLTEELPQFKTMFPIKQRYKNLSKSQRKHNRRHNQKRCFL